MKKIILIIVFSASIISLNGIMANAQVLNVDARIGDMNDIDESKYLATGITVTRNSNGELISVTRADATRYLESPIIDTFLESDQKYLIKKGIINGEKVKMYQVDVEYYVPECLTAVFQVPGYDEECDWYHRAFVTMLGVDDEGERVDIFRGLNHVFVIKSSDEVTTHWTILTKD
tara:strand:+ start:274 stop:798 length:525 start_codon:yes stop_codon:yes gene_type:complete